MWLPGCPVLGALRHDIRTDAYGLVIGWGHLAAKGLDSPCSADVGSTGDREYITSSNYAVCVSAQHGFIVRASSLQNKDYRGNPITLDRNSIKSDAT
jgi:hypothetical protein